MKREFVTAALIGFPEALLVGIPLGLALMAVDPLTAGGVFLGLAAVAAGRLLGLLFVLNVPKQGKVGLASGLMGTARLLVVGAIAVAGIVGGLSPLGVVIGLALPPLALWIKSIPLGRTRWEGS